MTKLAIFSLLMITVIGSVSMADVFKVGRELPRVDLFDKEGLVDLRSQVKGKTLLHIFASW